VEIGLPSLVVSFAVLVVVVGSAVVVLLVRLVIEPIVVDICAVSLPTVVLPVAFLVAVIGLLVPISASVLNLIAPFIVLPASLIA
jgi:hypothetical protein